jgi:hypothetical protein
MIFTHHTGHDFHGCYVQFWVEYEASKFVPKTYSHPAEGGCVEEIRSVEIEYIEGFNRRGDQVYSFDPDECGDWLLDLERAVMEEIQHNIQYWEGELLDHANSQLERTDD